MNQKSSKAAHMIVWLSVTVNIILFAAKLAVGLRIGSVAMTADAWHTLSDSLTSLIVIFSFWISARPRDMEHPFGHGRVELIASIVIGTLLLTAGISFIMESVDQFRENRQVEFDWLSIGVFAASFFIKEIMAQASIRIGKKLKLKSLEADGWHHRSDAAASALIVAGAFSSQWLWWLDSLMGVVVSLLIIYTAWRIIKESADTLMGEIPEKSLSKKVEGIISMTAPEANNLHHFHIHRYGAHLEATFHLELPPDYSLRKAHATATEIEESLLRELNICSTIHCEPRPVDESDSGDQCEAGENAGTNHYASNDGRLRLR